MKEEGKIKTKFYRCKLCQRPDIPASLESDTIVLSIHYPNETGETEKLCDASGKDVKEFGEEMDCIVHHCSVKKYPSITD
jgi:hypothetical protein